MGDYEVKFAYDGGARFEGLGVQRAVDSVNNLIGPALNGMDATRQVEIDRAMLELDGTPDRTRLGGNTIASVSAAVLKAGAASLGIPLYEHIGGVNACVLPVPGAGLMNGARRYGGGERAGDKPSYSMMCYGFDTLCGGLLCGLGSGEEFQAGARQALDLDPEFVRFIPAGVIKHDRELWDIMTEVIESRGYEGKVGLQVDVAAGTYFDNEKGVFVGLFSAEDKTYEELFDLYKWMVKEYPFVILEDPLDEDDFEGHARLTRELPIEIVGDDLFTTNPERVQPGNRDRRCECRAAQGQPGGHDHRGVRDDAPGTPQRLWRHALWQSRRGGGHRRLCGRPDYRAPARGRVGGDGQPSAEDRGGTGQPRAVRRQERPAGQVVVRRG